MIVIRIVQMNLLRSIRIVTLLLSISMVQCQKAALRTNLVSVTRCAPEHYTKDKSFVNATADVVDIQVETQGKARSAYYLKSFSVSTKYLYACNLPEQVKRHGLRVKISGHTLTYPKIGLSNREAWPCELTSLNVIGE
jgi:hypothetical protein